MAPPHPALLRPDICAESVRLGDGKCITVYRCPYPSDGPVQIIGKDGRAALKFMYGDFVFTWSARSQTVDISHGTIVSSLLLWPAQPITGEWECRTLARFGESWTHHHLSRFILEQNGSPR